jgi:dihydrofolate reductase
MRRLVMWNLMSLDGCFEGESKWDLWFHETVWGPELERLSIEQTGAADMLLFGRVTWQGMAAHWTTAEGPIADIMNRIPKVVVSRTLEHADWSGSRILRGDAVEGVRALKQEGDGEILVFGSGELSTTLLANDLFDELRLCIAPVLLGAGTPLFHGDSGRSMKLLDVKPLATGGVIVRYDPVDRSALAR